MKAINFLVFTLSLLLTISLQVKAETDEDLIATAKSAAPSMISENATIMYRGKVLVKGTNEWTCMPETFPDDNAPICNDGTWMKLMQAMGEKAPFTANELGISYMLQGDGGVSNSDPYHSDHMNAPDYIKEGPHLMLVVPKEVMEGISDDPSSGEPYVMWGDTPYAHIMVPVGNRP
ncbi:MAG: hypothetical protein AB7U63_12310 [Porticoccaceae bacterium]